MSKAIFIAAFVWFAVQKLQAQQLTVDSLIRANVKYDSAHSYYYQPFGYQDYWGPLLEREMKVYPDTIAELFLLEQCNMFFESGGLYDKGYLWFAYRLQGQLTWTQGLVHMGPLNINSSLIMLHIDSLSFVIHREKALPDMLMVYTNLEQIKSTDPDHAFVVNAAYWSWGKPIRYFGAFRTTDNYLNDLNKL